MSKKNAAQSLLQSVMGYAGGRYPKMLPPILQQDPKKIPIVDKVKVLGPAPPYLAKNLSAEALDFLKARRAVQKRIDAGDYDPYFDVSKRADVDPSNYPAAAAPNQTLAIIPKRPDTIKARTAELTGPAVEKRLEEAFKKGLQIPDSDRWYFMKQLEDEFIKEYGVPAGRHMFVRMFADPMAATTGGAAPQSNLITAAYGNYALKAAGQMPEKGYNMPVPVGGRYIGGNAQQFNKMITQGVGVTPDSPKRYNFSTNFQGARDRATMDEQMSKVGFGKNMPPAGAYGLAELPVHNLAAKYGTDPRNVQEVIWHGGTGKSGKPMIGVINEAIERTSALTGKSPKEVLRKAILRAEMPLYSVGAGTAGLAAANAQKDKKVPAADILNYLRSQGGT
jgi:hypothetical protein